MFSIIFETLKVKTDLNSLRLSNNFSHLAYARHYNRHLLTVLCLLSVPKTTEFISPIIHLSIEDYDSE